MLVFTRRVGEVIMIGDDVKITITRINGGQVAVGIDAPKKIAVHREEIWLRIKEENKQ